MKLLHKTGRINLLFSTIILLVASITLFFIIRMVFTQEIEEQLQIKANQVVRQIESRQWSNDPFVKINVIEEVPSTAYIYRDTLVFDLTEQENEVYRQLTFTRSINDQTYRISVMTSRLEWDDLFLTILIIFIGMAVLLVIGSFFANTFITRKIWHPFFENLEIMKEFSVKNHEAVSLHSSQIEEFDELNAVLSDLTERVREDYRSFREFTENASHEIQTPLAIIQSKLDRLRQHPKMDEQMAESITSAGVAADRLSRLNSDLLMLSKLENQSFEIRDDVDLSELISNQVSVIGDLLETKSIELVSDIQKSVVIKGNKALCEIMVSNLLSNALRYTPENGIVEILLNNTMLSVSNSGEPLSFPKSQLFVRFKKGETGAVANGLGLAIVKEVVTLHQWTIRYRYSEGKHHFQVFFKL